MKSPVATAVVSDAGVSDAGVSGAVVSGAGDLGDGAAELMLMLLADARLPTGAHTQSAGLEPAMRAGLKAAQVPDFIRARIRTVTAVEAGTAVVARYLALEMSPAELADELDQVNRAWQARTLSAAMREASVMAARGYLRLLSRLWPEGKPGQALAGVVSPSRPVVLGVIAAMTGLSAVQLIRLIGSDDAQTIAAAVLKLEPLDPMTSTGWILEAHAEIDGLAGRLADLRDVSEIPALAAPLMEQWAQIHHTSTQRLFRA